MKSLCSTCFWNSLPREVPINSDCFFHGWEHDHCHHQPVFLTAQGLLMLDPRSTFAQYVSVHTMGTQQPGSSGLAQGHRGGKCLRGGVLKWTRAYTLRHHEHSETDENTHRYHENHLLICFILVLSCPSFSAHTSVQYSTEIENMDRVKLQLHLGPAT